MLHTEIRILIWKEFYRVLVVFSSQLPAFFSGNPKTIFKSLIIVFYLNNCNNVILLISTLTRLGCFPMLKTCSLSSVPTNGDGIATFGITA
jgi:hypothetical protein